VKLFSFNQLSLAHLGPLPLTSVWHPENPCPNRDAVFAGRGSSGTHCLSGRATVGAGESGGNRRARTLGCLDGGAHGRRSGGMGGPRGQCGFGAGPDVLLTKSDLSAVKTAASTPGGWQVTSTNAGVQTFPGFGTNTPGNPAYPNATIQFSATNVPLCAVDTEYLHDWVVGPFQSLSTAVFFTGNFFVNGPAVGGYSLYVCHRKGIPGSTSPIQDGLIPPTQQQVANFVGGLPASDPKSVEAHTNPVGTTGTTQPADTTISQAVTPTEMPTTVKPKPVPAGDIVVVDTVPPPASTPQQNTQQQTTTTTTTTTQNPDGSTTQHEETQATTSCAVGSHESRTFGTVLQAHQTIWATSGLLGTLNLLKSLTWPSTLPVIALPSAFFGSQQVDFNQWAWFFTVLRTLVIATASIAAYRIIFVGGGQTT
jgi:hypothetical protein